MAFEGLAEKLQAALKKLTGRGKLNESDVKAAMREVRMALLEADVNFIVVKDFIKKVTQRAVGSEIMSSLNPGQQVIKIVNQELVEMMGGESPKLNHSNTPPSVIMLCGLQGAGKTTMAAKLANWLIKQGKKPLLVACDIYRPSAIKQLQIIAETAKTPVFEKGTQNPVKTAKESIEHARYYGHDVVILDTAGRLHIDEDMMDELVDIKTAVSPDEILLVVDAMTGQDAVNVSQSFNEKLTIDGVILTKFDGDTRGGAALSIRAVIGKPIKFCGIGEKINDIEAFHPDRMASRILGMGDVLSLIEKAEQAFDESKAMELEKKLKKDNFTLDDFLDQMQQIKKMGSLDEILAMLPGVGNKLSGMTIDEKKQNQVEAIIQSMTKREREHPEILNASRRKRIAAGSGTSVPQVNQLMKQFEQSRAMMRQMMGGRSGKKGRFKMPF